MIPKRDHEGCRLLVYSQTPVLVFPSPLCKKVTRGPEDVQSLVSTVASFSAQAAHGPCVDMLVRIPQVLHSQRIGSNRLGQFGSLI